MTVEEAAGHEAAAAALGFGAKIETLEMFTRC